MQDDGTTSSGCWIYSGCFNEAGNNMARRDNVDHDGLGTYAGWTWAWPINRRIIYNRASADLHGKPWDPTRKIIEWDGQKWTGGDVPDIGPTAKPEDVGPFIMNAEGSARLFARGLMKEGPFPVHYEPFESPIPNPINPKIRGNPAARVFAGDMAQFATSDEFPYAATSYRLTEHFHYWTKPQPGERSAPAGVLRGDLRGTGQGEERAPGKLGAVWSKRGSVKAKALVTKRIKPLICDGKTVHVVGIPLHWASPARPARVSGRTRSRPSSATRTSRRPSSRPSW